MTIVTNYAITGVNPALSIWQFQNNGVGDFELPKVWWNIMSMGGGLDAPDYMPKGCCNYNCSIPAYVLRD